MSLIGRLRSRVSIQAETVTRDAYGAEVSSWGEVFKLWGQKETVKGDEVVNAQQLQAVAQYTYLFRYDSRLTTKHRIVDGSKTYNVTYIDDAKKFDGDMRVTVSEAV